jgi:hypothetical protein
MNDQSRLAEEEAGAWLPPHRIPPYAPLFHQGLNEHQLNAALRRRALDYVQAHPGYIATVLLYNVQRTLGFDRGPIGRYDADNMGVPPWFFDAGLLASWALALVALAGLARRRVPALGAWFWAGLALLAITAVFPISAVRYRLPCDLFVIVIASAALATVKRRAAERQPAAVAV